MPVETKRLGYLDAVKGMGILLVVFAHVNFTPGPLVYAYSFHMPLFFILSGILFDKSKHTKFSAFMVHKLKSLICPYVLFSVATMCCSVVVDIIGRGIRWSEIFSGLLQIILSRGSQTIVNAALWFLTCLFVVEMIYFFIAKLDKVWIALISAVLAVVGWIMESGLLPLGHAPFPWSLDSAFFCMGFFALGNLFSGRIKQTATQIKQSKHAVWICLAVALGCFAIQLPVALLNGKVSVGSKILGNGFLYYITGVLGTVCFLALGVLFEKSKFLRYCGRNSLYILCMHWIVYMAVQVATNRVPALRYDNEDLAQTLLPFGVVLVGSLVGTEVYLWIKRKLIRTRN